MVTEESILDLVAGVAATTPLGGAAVGVAATLGLSTVRVAGAAEIAYRSGHGRRCAIFQAVAPDSLPTDRCICPGGILAVAGG